MYTITKEFHFEAAHHLPQMPDGHQCKRLHGHSYILTVELQSPTLDPDTGFVKDFGELHDIKQHVDQILDHRDLAIVFGAENTTAERMARRLYDIYYQWHPELTAVSVRETAKCQATYRPGRSQ